MPPGTGSDPELLRFEINDVDEALYLSAICKPAFLPMKHVLIVTELFKEVHQKIIETDKPCGVMIIGPGGTGKTSTCMYLWKKLKDANIPYLVCFEQSFDPDFSPFYHYTRGFCKALKIEDDLSFQSSPMAIVDVILRKCSSIKRVFFVDLGGTTKQDPKHIEFLLRLAEIAFVTGWNVVVSTCSGQDWKNVCDTAMADRITKSLHLLESNFETAQSKSFTDEEAEKFIWELKIDKEKLEKEIETGNNPRVLQQFINTQGSSEKYEMGMKSFNKMMRKMVNELLLAFKSKVYERSLSKCLQWLQYARHNVAIKGHNLQSYKESYLHQEKLTTYTECEGNSYKIKLHIPSVYPYLVDELKEQYTKRVSGVYELPIAQEFVFEAYFLQYKDLHSLSISAINVDNLTPRLFSFSSLTPAISQQRHAVTCLEEDHLFHLRTNHLAIDGVCVARGHDNEKYLLLLQVSLSTYKAHVSKGIAIQKCVGLLEETVHGSVSIAQYYQKVGGGDIPDDKVIYAYVSPEETISNPSDQTFLDELQVHGTRSGDSSPPKYWYGFIHSSMASVIKTIKDTI